MKEKSKIINEATKVNVPEVTRIPNLICLAYRITGLDPASIGFENRPNNVKIHGGSAEYVDLIHSDPSKYGYRKSMGTVDFWPNFKNGAVVQPGCPAGGQQMFSLEGDFAYLLRFDSKYFTKHAFHP